jgi:hypothetical protein
MELPNAAPSINFRLDLSPIGRSSKQRIRYGSVKCPKITQSNPHYSFSHIKSKV